MKYSAPILARESVMGGLIVTLFAFDNFTQWLCDLLLVVL